MLQCTSFLQAKSLPIFTYILHLSSQVHLLKCNPLSLLDFIPCGFVGVDRYPGITDLTTVIISIWIINEAHTCATVCNRVDICSLQPEKEWMSYYLFSWCLEVSCLIFALSLSLMKSISTIVGESVPSNGCRCTRCSCLICGWPVLLLSAHRTAAWTCGQRRHGGQGKKWQNTNNTNNIKRVSL